MPKVKIVSVPTYFDTSNKEVVTKEILNFNSTIKDMIENNDSTFEYLLSYDTKSSKTLIFKCSPDIRKHIKELNDKIVVDFQECRVFDTLHIRQCSKCCAFGHSKSSCKSIKDTCTNCGENHNYNQCPVKLDSTKHKCINCTNEKYDNVNHSAFSQSCPVLKQVHNKIISRINFGIPNPFQDI